MEQAFNEGNFMQADENRYKEDMPALGLNWIRLGLDDVLYDPKTQLIYTPNTNAYVKMGEAVKQVDDEQRAWLKGEHGYFAGSTPGVSAGGGVMHASVDSDGGALNDIKLSATSAETVDKANESDIIRAKEDDIRNNVIPNMKTDKLAPRQDIHRQGTKMYERRQAELKAKGQIKISKKTGEWDNEETILTNDTIVGIAINNLNEKSAETSVFRIHYSNKGVHIVPDYPSKKRGRSEKT
ncbi:polymorphic toxin type 50 domain-containing protein [uncultured Ruminococcus sp.]|uniref:polymorphic toxin type 50 domain-containing protein n=1 Tax=uncultured Ruminococcus sp. TaxID=165186 RepID=UPI0025FAA740|nr:polymorphic toxin type 50 domain-containing protein [uncultured Ruminococcus sp.]